MKDMKKINEDKSSALVNLINHIDTIKKSSKNNKTLLNEINNDNKIILKELDKITRKLEKK